MAKNLMFSKIGKTISLLVFLFIILEKNIICASAAYSPDLVLSNFQFSSNSVTQGEKVIIKAKIRNIGFGDANGAVVIFYDGNSSVGKEIGRSTINTVIRSENFSSWFDVPQLIAEQEYVQLISLGSFSPPQDVVNPSNWSENLIALGSTGINRTIAGQIKFYPLKQNRVLAVWHIWDSMVNHEHYKAYSRVWDGNNWGNVYRLDNADRTPNPFLGRVLPPEGVVFYSLPNGNILAVWRIFDRRPNPSGHLEMYYSECNATTGEWRAYGGNTTYLRVDNTNTLSPGSEFFPTYPYRLSEGLYKRSGNDLVVIWKIWDSRRNKELYYSRRIIISPIPIDVSVEWDTQKASKGEHEIYALVNNKEFSGGKIIIIIKEETTSPIITNLFPLDGSDIYSRGRISGNYSDKGSGIDVSSVRIYLDSVEVTAYSNITGAGFSYVPVGLFAGSHMVQVFVKDNAGNQAVAEWHFALILNNPSLLATFEGETDFPEHNTGKLGDNCWEVGHSEHSEGYLVRGLNIPLEEGDYVSTFYLFRGEYGDKKGEWIGKTVHDKYKPGDYIITNKNVIPIFRIEVWDLTTGKLCQQYPTDTELGKAYNIVKYKHFEGDAQYQRFNIEFTTRGKPWHTYDIRLYWYGYWNGGVDKVDLSLARGILELPHDFSYAKLNEKAQVIDTGIIDRHMLNQQTLTVNTKGDGPYQNFEEEKYFDEFEDSATWTGLYVASQAFRYGATGDPEALNNMHASLRALHRLHYNVQQPGVVARYIHPDGTPCAKVPSKDTYTGIVFGYGVAYPLIRDVAIKENVERDMSAIAGYFIEKNNFFGDPILFLHLLRTAINIIPPQKDYDGDGIEDQIKIKNYYDSNLRNGLGLLTQAESTNVSLDKYFSDNWGDEAADAVRVRGTHHLGWLALYNLINFETNPDIKLIYKRLLEEKWLYVRDEYNTFYNFVHAIFPYEIKSECDVRDGLWSLYLFSEDRHGTGREYRNDPVVNEKFGGEIKFMGYKGTRYPIPIKWGDGLKDGHPWDVRLLDTFIWQRSPRRFSGDNSKYIYSGLDYIFTYWMNRFHNLINAIPKITGVHCSPVPYKEAFLDVPPYKDPDPFPFPQQLDISFKINDSLYSQQKISVEIYTGDGLSLVRKLVTDQIESLNPDPNGGYSRDFVGFTIWNGINDNGQYVIPEATWKIKVSTRAIDDPIIDPHDGQPGIIGTNWSTADNNINFIFTDPTFIQSTNKDMKAFQYFIGINNHDKRGG